VRAIDAAGNESYAPAATGATSTKACAATAPANAPATPDSGAVDLGILGL